MNHLQNQELRDYLNDSLDEKRNRDFESHLADCPACLANLESIVDAVAESFMGSVFQKSSASHSIAAGSQGDLEIHFGLGHRFLILNELARGGMGIIFRGFDRELKRQVAIKVLRKDQEADCHRFYREAQISGQLQHPGIVPIHETGRLEDGRMYIAMKLVAGQTLQELVESEKDSLTLSELFGMFTQICETLAYAHSQNIVHRDLKPQNVMVGNFGEVQVMDWGLAKKNHESELDHPDDTKKYHVETIRQSDTETQNQTDTDRVPNSPLETMPGEVFGTPAFMSPEQAHGHYADQRTDVFALGGILFYLLTGTAPFEAPTKTLALTKSRNHNPAALLEELESKQLDEELVSLVEQCLASNIESRPRDAGEVSELFRAYVAKRERQFEESRIEGARASERLIAQQKRSRQITWFSAGIIAMLLATTIAGYMYLTERNRRASDLAKTELEQVKRRSETENRIRVGLTSAKNFQRLAQDADPEAMQQHWQAAVYEIKQARSLTDESISDSLLSEIEFIGTDIQSQADRFFESVTRQEEELGSREIIRKTCYQSLYPPSLRLALLERLTDQFAEAYKSIGIVPGDLSDAAADRIANSQYKPFLIHGLLLWRIEVGRESRRFGPRSDDEEIRIWLDQLTAISDQDAFRAEIRDAIRTKEFHRLTALYEKEEAISSLATVLLCTPLVEFLPDADDRVKYLLRARQFFPDEFQLQWKLSAVNGLESEAKKELAFRAALTCYALEPGNPAVLMNLGATYIQQKNYDLAIESLEQVVEIAPNFIDAQYNLGNAYWRSGNHDSAIKCCQKILSNSKDHFWATQLLALVREDLGQIDDAIVDFKRAARLNPQSGAANYSLYNIYLERGELDNAEKSLMKVVKATPRSVTYKEQLAALYVKMKKWKLAEETFQSVLDRKPKSTSTVASLANLFLQRNRPEDSERLLRESIFNGVNSHSVQLELAKSLLAQSKNDSDSEKQNEGLRILERLAELVPGMTAPAKILSQYKEE